MGRSRHMPCVWDARTLFEDVRPGTVVAVGVRRLVDAKLAHVRSWRSSAQGFATEGRPQPTPRDDRLGGYPGTQIPGASADPDNQAHLRWVLCFVSTLYEIRVRYTTVADLVGMEHETLKDLLTGVRYGLPETRVRATWALYRCMLANGFSLGSFLVWLENDGNWTPQWPLVSNWGFDTEGFVTAEPVLPARRHAG